MGDQKKTKEQLIRESAEMYQRISELEKSENKCKQAEDLLKETEAILRALINATRETLLLIDKEGTVLVANEVVAQRLGKSSQELIGTCLYNHFPPDIAKLRKEHFDKVAITGESIRFEDTRAGRFYETYCYPVFNEKGKVSRLAIFAHDITDRKEAEETVRESKARYSNIFENTVEGIYQSTLEGQFISVNPAMVCMHGYESPEEMIMSITNIGEQLYVDPKERMRYRSLLDEYGIVEDFEAQFYRKDGTIIWASLKARAVKDATGKVLYFEGTVEDITSRKQAEAELTQTLEKLRRALGGIIHAMAVTVETRDPYTSGHQKRVSSLARVIAQEMGLSKDTIEGIRMAGMIHDIGKISVPAEILSKPTKLSNMEFGLIKVHPQSGYNILKEIYFPWPVAQIVLQHHERLNGSGYPNSLKNGQILLEAKILAVADVVEAMASYRPYRPALGIDVALEEIEKNKVTLYETQVVDVCLELLRGKGFGFEQICLT